MTSKSLFVTSEKLKNVDYRIVGRDFSLPVDSSLCATIEDADKHAIAEAIKYAKDFRNVTLYKKVGNQPSVIIYRSVSRKERVQARVAKFFTPAKRAHVSIQY